MDMGSEGSDGGGSFWREDIVDWAFVERGSCHFRVHGAPKAGKGG